MVDRPGDLLIREASVAEAEAVAVVLRRSITELCVAEHGNATAVIDAWLANKTAESVGDWIADPSQTLLVAIIDGEIAGVAAASRFSQVLLNYVSPSHRFCGVSKALMAALEAYLGQQGCSVARLTSTATAHGFYLGLGYQEDGPPQHWRGDALVYPMKKAL